MVVEIVRVRSGLGRVLVHSGLAVDLVLVLVLVQARSKVRDLPGSTATAATQFARAARAAELTTGHPRAAAARARADRALPSELSQRGRARVTSLTAANLQPGRLNSRMREVGLTAG